MPSANAVHLVGSNHKWGLEALENAQGLDGLGLEALVYIHDQHCQIGQGAAPAAHGCECMVAGVSMNSSPGISISFPKCDPQKS